jgi:hypothetical protein
VLGFLKTRRDIFSALLATTIAALLFDYSCEAGFPIAAYAIDDASF